MNQPILRFVKAMDMLGVKGVPALFSEGCDPTKCAEETDGLILIGGADLDPSMYGEINTKSRDVCREYDEHEYSMVRAFLGLKKPVLGVCRGFQFLNVYFGGTLHQDIPDHHREETDPHPVTLTDGTVLRVNSTHHQAVKDLGRDLTVFAVSSDGIIEGFRGTNAPVLAVEWHPERLIPGEDRSGAYEGAAEHPAGLPILREFVGMG